MYFPKEAKKTLDPVNWFYSNGLLIPILGLLLKNTIDLAKLKQRYDDQHNGEEKKSGTN